MILIKALFQSDQRVLVLLLCLTHHAVFDFNRTAGGQETSPHVDFHDVSSCCATVDKLIVF